MISLEQQDTTEPEVKLGPELFNTISQYIPFCVYKTQLDIVA